MFIYDIYLFTASSRSRSATASLLATCLITVADKYKRTVDDTTFIIGQETTWKDAEAQSAASGSTAAVAPPQAPKAKRPKRKAPASELHHSLLAPATLTRR